jgi:hypothetical protein
VIHLRYHLALPGRPPLSDCLRPHVWSPARTVAACELTESYSVERYHLRYDSVSSNRYELKHCRCPGRPPHTRTRPPQPLAHSILNVDTQYPKLPLPHGQELTVRRCASARCASTAQRLTR